MAKRSLPSVWPRQADKTAAPTPAVFVQKLTEAAIPARYDGIENAPTVSSFRSESRLELTIGIHRDGAGHRRRPPTLGS
jgi:hypothetical protein